MIVLVIMLSLATVSSGAQVQCCVGSVVTRLDLRSSTSRVHDSSDTR